MKRKDAGKNSIPRIFTLLIAGFLLAVGCQKQSEQGPPPARIPEVATVTIASQRVELTTDLPGRTSAFRIAEIRPQVNGLILKRIFEEGADVEAGQTLYRIDPVPFQVALDSAEASLGRGTASRCDFQLVIRSSTRLPSGSSRLYNLSTWRVAVRSRWSTMRGT